MAEKVSKNNNNNSGKRYYNNGIENRMIRDGEPIPDGFVLGMCKRSKESVDASNVKRKQTNLDKYGVTVPLKSKELQEKVKQTNLKRYGVENPSLSKEIRDKRKETFISRYGVDNPMRSEEIKGRFKDTNLDRYNVENPFASDNIKSKIRETNLKNLGVEYPMQSKEVQEKSKDTCFEHYGVSSPLKSDEVKDKVKSTNLERLGVEYPCQSEVIKEKSRQTLLENYGVENPMKSEEIKNRLRHTNLERYGVSYNFQDESTKKKIHETCKERYGVDWACMRPEARVGSNDSGPNKAFADILDKEGISYEREFSLEKYSYDFKIDKILVEIDPTVTHNILWSPFGSHEGIKENYHRDKSLLAEKYGYRCIHIFDWDDVSIILNLLKSRKSIYARKCEIKEVSLKDTAKFLLSNHLQGMCKGQSVRLGLYYDSELISLMTFGKPRYNKSYEWELIRYCSSYNIIGGESKLFKAFLQLYEPKNIISYCDRSKFVGKVYKLLGFENKNTASISRHWYSIKDNRHITDNLLRQRGYDQLFGTNYGKGTSNEELIVERGYLPVCDCGQDVWVYKRC